MKIIRSSKCSVKFATQKKKIELQTRNRNGEIFKCQACGYTDNADVNAALNIVQRFLTGKYGSCYKPKNEAKLACPVLSSL